MSETKRRARIAGVLYLVQAVTAPFGLIVMPNAIFVAGDATATAERIRQSESLFRLGIASELFHQALAVFIVLALFRLFRSVSETADGDPPHQGTGNPFAARAVAELLRVREAHP